MQAQEKSTRVPFRFVAAIALVAALSFAPIGPAQTRVDPLPVATGATFTSVADAYVSSAKPKTNYGTSSRLKAVEAPSLRTYLRFAVGAIGAPVTRATLWLYAINGSSTGYDVHGVGTSSWLESSITYASAPTISTAAAGSSGAYASGSWTSVDVTPLVTGGGSLSLAVTTSSMTVLSVASRESRTAPVLVVDTSPRDTTPPDAPVNLAVTAATGSSVSLGWSPSTDDVGVAGYGIYGDGTLTASSPQTSYTLTGLTCGSSYTVAVDAYDAAGNRSPRTSLVTATSSCPDTLAPTPPSNLAVTSTTATGITLFWNPSIDNTAVSGYDLFQDGAKTATTPAISYSFTGLTCGTTYALGVESYDAAGNHSTRTSLTATTSTCGDTQAPTAPANLTKSSSTDTSISVSWTASTDNTGVTGYNMYRDGNKLTTTTATSYTFTGLTCGTSYALAVEAYDAAGNRSARTALVAATTGCLSNPSAQIKYRFAYSNRSAQALMPQYGYNLIDVATKSEADATPAGTLGQVWLWDYNNTTCSWELDDATISARVSAMADDPKVAGFYFSNEPDPFACPNAPQQHRDRNALIKSLAPNKYTLIGIDANWREHFDAYGSMWVGAADYVNYNPYICYESNTSTCDFVWLDHVIATAQALPQPYFIALQAFREVGEWRWPTPSEETQMLNRLKNPALTRLNGYLTFSWNWNNDPLLNHPDVLQVIKDFNLGASGTPTDTTAPSAPGGLSKTASTPTSVSLSWSASTDNVAVTGYNVYRDGTLTASSPQTSYTLTGLTCGSSYTVAVDAYDAAGNRSPSSTLAASTNACSAAGDPVVAAAGDICGSTTDCAPTAALLGQINPDRVVTLGDNAYEDGSLSQYTSFYDPNWGKFRAKTSPAPGNHDYHTLNGQGYFDYFGAQAPGQYYSYDVGSWHLISLNGEIGVSAGSAQEQWLKADLAAHTNQCTLAYWHEPRFSSGWEHGSNSSFDPFWRDLYAAGADVVLNGHDHDYERFALQNPSGVTDPKGIREFVVGTGGAGLYTFAAPIANSEVRDNTSFGVLKLTLHAGSYDWKFVPVAGATLTDSGSTACH